MSTARAAPDTPTIMSTASFEGPGGTGGTATGASGADGGGARASGTLDAAPRPGAFPVDAELAAVRAAVKLSPPARPANLAGAGAADADDESDSGELMIWSINLVYGELLVPSVVALVGEALRAVRTARLEADAAAGAASSWRAAFVDLGSGEGAPALAAAAAYPRAWRSLLGIELVPRLHRLACAHRDGLAARAAARAVARTAGGGAGAAAADDDAADVAAALARVRFVCDDMLRPGLSWPADADVVFVNGTCYDEATLGAIYKALEALSPGAVAIVTSHELPAASGAARLFELLHEAPGTPASWGSVTARVYRRLRLPRWLAGIKT